MSVGNGWNVGGGVKLTPKARLDDGLFDICLVRNISRAQIVMNLNRLYDGTMDVLPEVEMFQTDKVLIESDQIIPMHLDGESVKPSNRLEISLHPKSLSVIGNWSKDPR
jgi:diacylglycerol kinase (ATP)